MTDDRRAVARPEPTRDRTGTWVLGRFQLRKELHRGSSGEVWLARERETRELFVARLASTTDAAARLHREGRALARTRHPGLPRLIERGDLPGGGLCLIEEYVDGAQLSKILRVTTPSPSRSAGWGRQLAAAVAHLHAAGVVHGDVEPDNVIVARTEVGRDRLVLVGLGLATIVHPRLSLARGRGTGRGPKASRRSAGRRWCPRKPPRSATPLGSIAIAAPERIRGEPPSSASDIYALGAVLYRLVADRWPFVGGEAAVLEDQLATPPPPFAHHAPAMRLPRGLEQIVFRCLAKDRRERYRSAEELGADLAAAEFSPHRDWVRVHGAELAAPTPVPVDRRPPWPWVGAGVVAAVLASLGLWWWSR